MYGGSEDVRRTEGEGEQGEIRGHEEREERRKLTRSGLKMK
jgi:hypothetical protein